MSAIVEVDFKFVEAFIRDKFTRPFKHRLKYLYFGMAVTPGTFIFSTTDDMDFKYCESLQATGLVHIKNAEHLEKLNQWLHYCKLDITEPFICYFEELIHGLNKVTWSNPKISFERNNNQVVMVGEDGTQTIIASRVDTYFTISKLQNLALQYYHVFFKDGMKYSDISYTDTKSTSIITKPIDVATMASMELSLAEYDIPNLVMLVGLDLLVQKSLIEKNIAYQSAIRLWTEKGNNSFKFGSYFNSSNIAVAVVRDNIFMFPKRKVVV